MKKIVIFIGIIIGIIAIYNICEMIESNKLKDLLNENHIMTSNSWFHGNEINSYPGTAVRYVNITENGCIYSYNDMGYSDMDMDKYELIYCKNIGIDKSKEIINELKKLDKIEENAPGININCEGNKFTVEKSDFDKILEGF